MTFDQDLIISEIVFGYPEETTFLSLAKPVFSVFDGSPFISGMESMIKRMVVIKS